VKPILLIEDSAGDVLLIKQVLSQANFVTTLRVAMDGEQALGLLADPAFKSVLIILDLNIPNVPGLQLPRTIPSRCAGRGVHVPRPGGNPTGTGTRCTRVREKPNEFNEFERVVMKMIHDCSDPRVSGTAKRSS
jgi:hypothetical protein